jgi:hypothetical protein
VACREIRILLSICPARLLDRGARPRRLAFRRCNALDGFSLARAVPLRCGQRLLEARRLLGQRLRLLACVIGRGPDSFLVPRQRPYRAAQAPGGRGEGKAGGCDKRKRHARVHFSSPA